MRANDFLFQVNEFFKIEFQRAQKIASGLRSEGLYPDARTNGIESHVTGRQAAHLLRALSLNLNPFAVDFKKSIDEFRKLISHEGKYFIDDLAEILYQDGAILPNKKGVNLVHHISFSLDRCRAVIVFEGIQDETEESEEPKIFQSEIIYGDGEVLPAERWCIIKRKALWAIGFALTESNHLGNDLNAVKEFHNHLNA